MKNIIKIRLTLFFFLLLSILFLLYRAVSPFGEITYRATPCDKSFFIQRLTPKDRLTAVDKKNCVQKIIGEPVYFNLQTPRTFNTAEVTLKYRTRNVPAVELGVQADERKNYRLKPLQNDLIDELDWHAVSDDGVYLLQRKEMYGAVSDFLNNLPDKEEVAVYHYDLPTETFIPDYRPDQSHTVIKRHLRGSYQFYTYVDGETAEFEFLFGDLNQNKDADNIKITLYDARNQSFVERVAIDDRGREETRQRENAGGIHLELTTLSPGFYKVAVVATDDTITEQLLSSQRIISFINRLWLAESADTGLITLYTDAGEITASTLNPAALQKILVNKDILTLTETYRQFWLPANNGVNVIQLAKDDVIISGSGVFSLAPEQLYNPSYRKLSKNQNMNGVNYIITSYTPKARAEGEWQIKTLRFDLKNTFRHDNAYGFIISAPGLIADDGIDDYVEIGEVEIKLKGRSFWEKINDMLNF